jgi:hypothetical protein
MPRPQNIVEPPFGISVSIILFYYSYFHNHYLPIKNSNIGRKPDLNTPAYSSKEISHKGLIALIFYNSYTYIDLYSESELG